jgi:hypothetical protein
VSGQHGVPGRPLSVVCHWGVGQWSVSRSAIVPQVSSRWLSRSNEVYSGDAHQRLPGGTVQAIFLPRQSLGTNLSSRGPFSTAQT